jgi:ubiquinone/menaquinone biosynthesis C-methylase UbiE
MDHRDHVKLIEKGVPPGGIWADLGSGRGAFTLALAECLGVNSKIYSIDLDWRALKTQETRMTAEFPDNDVEFMRADFTHHLDLPPLDGILMANALHFVHDKAPMIQRLRGLLKPGGRFVLVEYDTDTGNYPVPHPISFRTWQELAQECGLENTELLATRPSSFLGAFYAAVSYNVDPPPLQDPG